MQKMLLGPNASASQSFHSFCKQLFCVTFVGNLYYL